MRDRSVAGLALLAAVIAAPAASANTEVGEQGFHFLNLGTGARLEALAAGTVLAEGADALGWNPAATARLRGPAASVSYFNWMTGVEAGHIAALYPLRGGTVGFTATSLSVADIDNVAGAETVGESDLAVAGTAAYPLYGRWDGGGAVRYIRSSIASTDASGWAMDAALNYRLVDGWNVGMAVRNLGGDLSYGSGPREPLPTRTAIGGAATLGELRIGAEGYRESGPGWRAAVGAEYEFLHRVALRAGTRLGEKTTVAVDPWSAGIGLRVRPGLDLDYSFRTGTFDSSHRLGVRWTQGEGAGVGSGVLARSPREYYVDVVNEVIDQAMTDFPRGVRETIVVRPGDDHAAGNVVAEAVAGRLRDAGMTAEAGEPLRVPPVTDDPEKDESVRREMAKAGVLEDPNETTLTVDVKESKYAILSQARERWIGPLTLEREARVTLDLTLERPGRDAWTFSGQADDREKVAAGRIPSSAGYPKAGGTVAAAGNGVSPYLEPVIVGAIVSGLAVIFFSNRDVGN